MKPKEILLCPPQPGHCNPCCPKLIKKDDQFHIEDDYDSSIILEKDQINDIINNVNKIISLPRSGMDS
jgi:hypothetical protein